MYRRLAVLTLAIGLAEPLSAQRLERSHLAGRSESGERPSVSQASAIVRDSARDSRASVGQMLISGVAMGAAGMFAGGYLGYAAETSAGCADEFLCGLGGAILGGLIGESIGMSTGIHLAGDRRHSLAGDFLTALGIGALGVVAAPMSSGISLLVVPVAQLMVGLSRESKAQR